MPLEKIFSKFRNTNYIYIIVIIGAAVMLFSSFPEKEEKTSQTMFSQFFEEEKRLENILSEIDGVGDVSVMITYYGSGEKELAYEIKKEKRADVGNGSGGESSDEKVVMAEGEPVIVKEIYPEVKGVIVIADGAKKSEINQQICDAVSTSLGIAMHKICVLQKSDE